MKKNKWFLLCMIGLLLVQLTAVFWFGTQKQGFHYDEYYSYYSSNVTNALVPTDMEWMDTEGIRSEFMALKGEGLGLGMVRLMQSLDVHPPLYYYLLRLVCWLSPGIFSKWQGLALNVVFFILAWLTLAGITKEITDNNKKNVLAVCALFGFSPAVFSGVMFVRMYMMLTFVCLFILYVHICAITRQKRSLSGFYIPIMVLSFIGFHIHYYFAVFLFFLAAVVTLYLFFHKESRKESFIYAGFVLAGLMVSVLIYPACLGHIFRGYRGTEAQDAFFDFSNIGDRFSFFFDLTNEYVFGNMFVALLLCLILLGLTSRVKQKEDALARPERQAYMLTLIVTVGYFLVVAKTALLNAEEAIRYEMPVYGLLMVLVMVGLGSRLQFLDNGKNTKAISVIFAGLVCLTLAGEIIGLANDKVCFLYPQDKENIAWASEHRDEAVVYIYNPSNRWMIWDETGELMQYENIYFVSTDNETVVADERLSEESIVYVYAMRGDSAEGILQNLVQENGGFSDVRMVRELLYCDLYKLER